MSRGWGRAREVCWENVGTRLRVCVDFIFRNISHIHQRREDRSGHPPPPPRPCPIQQLPTCGQSGDLLTEESRGRSNSHAWHLCTLSSSLRTDVFPIQYFICFSQQPVESIPALELRRLRPGAVRRLGGDGLLVLAQRSGLRSSPPLPVSRGPLSSTVRPTRPALSSGWPWVST